MNQTDKLPDGIRWAGKGEPDSMDPDAIVSKAIEGLDVLVDLGCPRYNRLVHEEYALWARGAWVESRAAWERQISLPRWHAPGDAGKKAVYPREAGVKALCAVEARLVSALSSIDMSGPHGRLAGSEILSDYLAPVVERLGRKRDAAGMYLRARNLAEPLLGRDHPRFIEILDREASLLGDLGLKERAEACGDREGKIRQMWRALEEMTPSGEPEELIAHYTGVLARHPGYLLALVLHGEQLLRRGNQKAARGMDPRPSYKAAIADFAEDKGGNSSCPASMVLTAIAHDLAGDWEAAHGIDARSSWEAARPLMLGALRIGGGGLIRERLARLLEKVGQPARAVAEYRVLLGEVGDDPLLRASLARAEAAAGHAGRSRRAGRRIPVVARPATSGERTYAHVVLEFDDDAEANSAFHAIVNGNGYEDMVVIDSGASSICPSTRGRDTNQVRIEFWEEPAAREEAKEFRDAYSLGDRCVIEVGIPFKESLDRDKQYGDLVCIIEEHQIDVAGDPYCMSLDDLRRAVGEGFAKRIEALVKDGGKEEEVDDLRDALADFEEAERE